MSNFLKRLILTLISIPLLIFFLFWPQNSHIVIIIIYGILCVFIGSHEISKLINKKVSINNYLISIINTIIYIFAYFYANNLFNIQNVKSIWLLFSSFVIFIILFIFSTDISKKDLTKSFEKMCLTLFGIIYIGFPSFLMPFIFNINANPEKSISIFYNIDSHGTLTGSLLVLFLIVNVFANDIFSYIFGMLFGKNNIINLAASPKKSWAGYIGGFFSTFVFTAIFYLLFDKYLGFLKFQWHFYFILPFISGFLVPIGDLVESVIKRSVHVKDSGTIIMGRGGVLDSIDSILFFVPIYFIYIQFYLAIVS